MCRRRVEGFSCAAVLASVGTNDDDGIPCVKIILDVEPKTFPIRPEAFEELLDDGLRTDMTRSVWKALVLNPD